ncbi:hypothetical protein ES705_10020 [subsurface metagenome]
MITMVEKSQRYKSSFQDHSSLVVVESELREYRTMHKVGKPPALWSRYLKLSFLYLAPFIMVFLIFWFYGNPLNDSIIILLFLYPLIIVYCAFKGSFYYFNEVKRVKDKYPRQSRLKPIFSLLRRISIKILKNLRYVILSIFWIIVFVFLFKSTSRIEVLVLTLINIIFYQIFLLKHISNENFAKALNQVFIILVGIATVICTTFFYFTDPLILMLIPCGIFQLFSILVYELDLYKLLRLFFLQKKKKSKEKKATEEVKSKKFPYNLKSSKCNKQEIKKNQNLSFLTFRGGKVKELEISPVIDNLIEYHQQRCRKINDINTNSIVFFEDVHSFLKDFALLSSAFTGSRQLGFHEGILITKGRINDLILTYKRGFKFSPSQVTLLKELYYMSNAYRIPSREFKKGGNQNNLDKYIPNDCNKLVHIFTLPVLTDPITRIPRWLFPNARKRTNLDEVIRESQQLEDEVINIASLFSEVSKEESEEKTIFLKNLTQNIQIRRPKVQTKYADRKKGIACLFFLFLYTISLSLMGGVYQNRIFITIGFFFTFLYLNPPRLSLRKEKKESLGAKQGYKIQNSNSKKQGICLTSYFFFSVFSLLSIYVFNNIEALLISFFVFIIILKVYMPGLTNSRKKNVRFLAIIIIFSLIFFPMLLSWESLGLKHEVCPTPSFGIYPQHQRRENNVIILGGLDYTENLNDLPEITFNSLISIKFKTSCSTNKIITFHADLIPRNVSISGEINSEAKVLEKTHSFSSKQFKGPFSERDLYFKLDLSSTQTPVLPGKYQLDIFYIVQKGFTVGEHSSVHSYEIEIQKEYVFFIEKYSADPGKTTRKGSIYTIENLDLPGWTTIFETRIEDSLGNPIPNGIVSLYTTDYKDGNIILKKSIDYQVEEDGFIYYKANSRYFGKLTRGKLVIDGSQSLYYKTTTHLESAELSEDKFVHSSDYPTNGDFLYNGTEFKLEEVNQFKTRTHLLYFHDFSIKELQWVKSPSFCYYTGTSDFIYLNTKKSTDTYIESPIITYLGTKADLAYLSYRYQLYNYESLNDEIWVDLQSQLWRDGVIVRQQFDYRGFYNEKGGNWKTIETNLTNYFQEGGQQFKIKILANFTASSHHINEISIRFDYAKLEVYHPPVYFRDFTFHNGFNEFTSPVTGTTESFYWDLNNTVSEEQFNAIIGNNFSLEAIPNGSSPNSFGILTKLKEKTEFSESEFLITNQINLDNLEFLKYENLSNCLIDLDAKLNLFSFINKNIAIKSTSLSGALETEMLVMTESFSDPDLVISSEIIYDDFANDYILKDLNLRETWDKDFGELFYNFDTLTNEIEVPNIDQYLQLSAKEQEDLFILFKNLYEEEYHKIYLVFKFKINIFNTIQDESLNNINVWFNRFQLYYSWMNFSGFFNQTYLLERDKNPFIFFEKLTSDANLNLLSDFGIEIEGRNDLISFSSLSDNYFGTLGVYDSFGKFIVDENNIKARTGIVSPNLYSNNTNNYTLRAIIDFYPFLKCQEDIQLESILHSFNSNKMDLNLEIFNQYGEKIATNYGNPYLMVDDLDVNDFASIINNIGEKYYFTIKPMKLYVCLNEIITSTDYIYLKLISEFSDKFNSTITYEQGVFLDTVKLEFIQEETYFEEESYSEPVNNHNNDFSSGAPIYFEDIPSFLENMTINGHNFEEIVFFNDHTNLTLKFKDNDNVSSVKIHAIKILGDPAFYTYIDQDKQWFNLIIKGTSNNPNSDSPYLTSESLTYSFFDGYDLNGTFNYENVIHVDNYTIPFKDLDIIDIERIYTNLNVSIPFYFDPIAQELTIDHEYARYLNSSTNLILKGVKCDLGWNSSFSFEGEKWILEEFNVVNYLSSVPEWFECLYGFENDESSEYVHYKQVDQYTKDMFEFYFSISYDNGSKKTTPIYNARNDNVKATGIFGKILRNSEGETKVNYHMLGETGNFRNFMFGTSNPEHRTLYFTLGYEIINVGDSEYYISSQFPSPLNKIRQIELYNQTNSKIGAMNLDYSSEPIRYFTIELDSKYFNEGFNWIKAIITDQADNSKIIYTSIYVYKELNYSFSQSLNFGDTIYYNQERNYTQDPHQFFGFLNSWVDSGRKSNITVEISYFNYNEQIWIPLGSTVSSDGSFTVDWHEIDESYKLLLPSQRGYLPVNLTYYERPPAYFYGGYGKFDNSKTLSPFLIDETGKIYIYHFNHLKDKWIINKTIELGVSLDDNTVSALDLNDDDRTDLVFSNKIQEDNRIHFYIYNSKTKIFDLNQTINIEQDISYSQALAKPVIRDYLFDFTNRTTPILYLCISNASNDVNFILKLSFDLYLNFIQESITQIPANYLITKLSLIKNRLFIYRFGI